MTSPPPAERCPVCGWPYDSLGHRDKCDESAEPAAPSLKDDPIFGDNPTHDHVGRPLPAKAPQSENSTSYGTPKVMESAAAEVRDGHGTSAQVYPEKLEQVQAKLEREQAAAAHRGELIDQLRRELEEAKRAITTIGDMRDSALEERDEARADWESAEKANARLREECERLRAACKRNPSSGSCIEALGNGGT